MSSVHKYLIEQTATTNMVKKLQFTEICTSLHQTPQILRPLYDENLEGVLLQPDGSVKALYEWSSPIKGPEQARDNIIHALPDVAIYAPLIPSLDSITREIWYWQTQFDGRASISGVLNHLKNEIKEFEETEQGSEEQEKEFADLYILLMHLAALSNIDIKSAITAKLDQVKKRDYSAQPDAEGCITHKK